ncbi:U32 family peptidase [Blautia sp. MSJ-19]|nr:U32 family peptidase [Blautia sp. MSJ-19]
MELLAPAGSYEAFISAIGAGADAVYVGGPDFGARAYAQNFSQEELLQAIHVAHIHDKKLYLTVNTLLKNREIQERLYDSLLPAYEEGLDAVIVQDFGVFQFIKQNFPGLHLHASTQMTVTGPGGMKFLEEQGATRVVAARELSLLELRTMHQTSPIEIEAFIHGALCYSFSGQCLMSSMLGGRSGNRGRCAQPCRLSYQVRKPEDAYQFQKDFCPLSLKDMCTIDLLPEILNAGVTSLKIEGRMKQPGYTAAVTGMYRKYLDILLNSDKPYHVADRDRQDLLRIFSRGGSCPGYYQQHNGSSMMAFSNEKKTSGLPEKLPSKKESISGFLFLYPQSPAFLEVSCRGIQVTVSAGEVQFAKEQPMAEERVRKQMEKLGNTEFEWKELNIQMGDHIFIPVRTLNELRRNALMQLEDALCTPTKRSLSSHPVFSPDTSSSGHDSSAHILVSCENIQQAETLCLNPEISGMYLYYDAMEYCIHKEIQKTKDLYLSLPYITRGAAPDGFFDTCRNWLAAGMKGFLVKNLESYEMLKEAGWQQLCILDASVYTWNNESIAFWQKENILRNTVPYELNEKEIAHRNNSNSEMIIYGYIPLMLSAQCVRKNTAQCDCSEESMILKDRYDKEFHCNCICHPWKTGNTAKEEYCYNILYNSLPLGLLKESRKIQNLGIRHLRLNFTLETPQAAAEILQQFLQVYLHHGSAPDRDYTKGHFKRGAE